MLAWMKGPARPGMTGFFWGIRAPSGRGRRTRGVGHESPGHGRYPSPGIGPRPEICHVLPFGPAQRAVMGRGRGPWRRGRGRTDDVAPRGQRPKFDDPRYHRYVPRICDDHLAYLRVRYLSSARDIPPGLVHSP